MISAHSCLQKLMNLLQPFSASAIMTDSIVPCMPQGPAAVHTMVAATWLPDTHGYETVMYWKAYFSCKAQPEAMNFCCQ